MRILSELLYGPVPHSPADAGAWKIQWRETEAAGRSLGERALIGGLGSACPAWAFAWGYQAALHRMVPSLVGVGALAVSEGRDTRPRGIGCHLSEGRLKGRKTYVFLGAQCDTVLVVAKQGEAEGRPILKVYPVTSGAEGVSHTPLGPTPFVPEVPHSAVAMDLPCPPPLPGDGWSDYARPFRTLEDLFVTLAMLGHGARACREAGLDQALEGLLPSSLALLSLSAADSQDPGVHRALEGCMAQALDALNTLPWSRISPDAARIWRRDQALFALGQGARGLRRDRARRHGL